MPSLSHHYAFSIPSLCLSYAYAFLYPISMPSLSHHYAFSIPSLCLSYAYAFLYPITMPMPIIAMPSLSHHYAYAYHRYPYLSLRRHLNHFRVLSTCEGLWGFFLALIRCKIIIISRGTRRKKITASFWFSWRREMLFHIHQVMQDPHLPYYSHAQTLVSFFLILEWLFWKHNVCCSLLESWGFGGHYRGEREREIYIYI